MTRKDDCIKDMESGMPWKELLGKYPKSTVYDSVNEYYEIAERKYSENLNKNQELSQRIRNQESILKENENSIQSQEKQESVLVEKIGQLDEKKADLSNEVANLENLCEGLSSRIGELEDKGITPEVLEDILKTDIKSSEDLTRRVHTRQQYEALEMKIQKESEILEQLKSEVEDESVSLDGLREDIKSEENRIAQLRETYAHLSDAIEVVMDALVRYPVDLIKGLFETLRSYEIKDAPAVSVRRLLDRFSLAKEDLELQRTISSRTKEFEAISQELDDTRGILRSLKKDSLKPIRDIQNSASRAIEQASVEGVDAVRATQKVVLQILLETQEAIINTIESLNTSGKDSLTALKEEIFRILNQSSLWLQSSLLNYESQIQQWGEDKREAGRYQSLINQATLLFGILEDSRAILNLDLRIASRVAERLHLYISMKYADAKTRAPADVAKEYAISNMWDVELSSLTKWLNEAMKDLREAHS